MRLRPAWAAIAVVVALVGCGKREPGQADHPTISEQDSLVRAIAPELAEWIEMWRVAIPGFSAESLTGSPPAKMRPLDVVTADRSFILGHERDSSAHEDLASRILRLPSPDGRRVLDVDSYQMIQVEQGAIEAGGEPDSRSALLDRSTQTEAVLFLTGTMAGAHWGKWLSADRFVLAGWQDTGEETEGRQGWLSYYDLKDSTVTDYTTRLVTPADYDRYYSAWKEWLLKRYHEVQARPQS